MIDSFDLPAQPAAGPRVALATCADLPELDPDDRHLLGPDAAPGEHHLATTLPADLADLDEYEDDL